jgi:hypothetical protein
MEGLYQTQCQGKLRSLLFCGWSTGIISSVRQAGQMRRQGKCVCVCFFFFLAVLGFWIQGLMLAKQSLHHLSHSTSCLLEYF